MQERVTGKALLLVRAPGATLASSDGGDVKKFFSRESADNEPIAPGAPPAQPGSIISGLTPFNVAIRSSQNSGDYSPVWEAFATTKFLVPVFAHGPRRTAADYEIAIRPSGGGIPFVTIAQQPELLVAAAQHEVAARKMTGADLVRALTPGIRILIALPSGETFTVADEAAQQIRDRDEPRETEGSRDEDGPEEFGQHQTL